MAKQSMIQREIKRENLIAKYETKREVLKQQLNSSDGSFKEKLQIYKKFEKIPRNSSAVRHRNRCWVTGRSRGFYRDFGLSRHVVREMAHEGIIPGLKNQVGKLLYILIYLLIKMTQRTLHGTRLKKVRVSGFSRPYEIKNRTSRYQRKT